MINNSRSLCQWLIYLRGKKIVEILPFDYACAMHSIKFAVPLLVLKR